MRRLIISLLLLCGYAVPGITADPLDLIPAAALEERQQESTVEDPVPINRSLQLIITSNSYRGGDDLVLPPPSTATPNWGVVTRINLQGGKNDGNLAGHWNVRLQLTRQDAEKFAFDEAAQLYIKELYASSADQSWFLDAGRINLRYGVASGFNPTDVYRSGAAINRDNADSSRQRDDRLGTVALRLTKLWNRLSTSLVYSPDLHAEQHELMASEELVGLQLPQTNNRSRGTAILSWQSADGLLVEGLLHMDESTPTIGTNLSYGLGRSWILTLENSISHRQSLLAARGTEADNDQEKHWQLQSVAGITWTSAANLSVTGELHYHQAGMSGKDWDNWFNHSTAVEQNPALSGKLWSVRQWAREEQVPLSRRQLYLRTSWSDAFIPDLTLNGVLMLNPDDGSYLTQLEVHYPVTEDLILTSRVIMNIGSKRSEHGSLPNRMVSLCQLEYYF